MEMSTAAILALLPALLPSLLLATVAVGWMVWIVSSDSLLADHRANQPAGGLLPSGMLIALQEPSMRSLIARRAAAPSRAPPFLGHLIGMTAQPYFVTAVGSLPSDRNCL
jgi:hypothetical protein